MRSKAFFARLASFFASPSFISTVHHLLGLLLQGLALFQQRFGDLVHGDPTLPQLRELGVEKIHLETGLQMASGPCEVPPP
jgi:hypothetical protein